MLTKDYIDFSKFEKPSSKFNAELSHRGGYITFSNSGMRGEKKYFTLGLDSFICCLNDIKDNLKEFKGNDSYIEQSWRDLGSRHFTDQPARAQITVQTKPMFSTISKIIMWANSPSLDSLNPETKIDLSDVYITEAIRKLEKLALEYTPKKASDNKGEIAVNNSSIRDFALKVFEYFYGDHWGSVISDAESNASKIGEVDFVSKDFGPFKRLLGEFSSIQDKESLTSSGAARYFEKPVYSTNNEYFYFSSQWNGTGDYCLSFSNLKSFFESNFHGCLLEMKGKEYQLIINVSQNLLSPLGLQLIPKPFLLLAGISGTGKTRFVREQARATDSALNNYCLVPVRPDWHEPSDLLGYTSRLSGHAEYVITDVLTFIVKAWQAAIPDADKDGMGAINDQSIPYWLCLDEMNLAPVEQYFADYLSVLESREFDGDAYRCEALLNKGMLQRLNKTDTHLQSNLGLDGCDDLWQYFLHHGISLPPNLIVAGTVNMDETTHGFSRKVIDRAITLDFGEFFPNVYADYFEPTSKPVVFTWSPLTHCVEKSLASAGDVGGAKSVQFLESVNAVLKRTPFELAYRALNELLLQVANLRPEEDHELQAIWDDFLMTKVLPRIDGDEDKLRSVIVEGEGTLLDDLTSILEANLSVIWNDKRKDYFRVDASGNAIDITCRSKAKLEWMKNRLAVNTFTSYWP